MMANSGRLFVALCALLPATLAATGAQVPVDPPQLTFRSAVDLVTIQASVRDTRGRSMKGLTTSDFEVRDNGQLRPILSLRADFQSPVSLAILVDMSGSMRIGSKIAMARQAFDSVLSQLRVGEDEVAVFTFDSRLHERQDFTRDLAALRSALAAFEPFGTTSLYDVTAEAARRLAARSGAHKAIIVLTDGIDTSSTLSASEVSGLASSIDVPVYVVATVPSIDQRTMMELADRRSESADLRDLAEWTGGQLVFASTFTETAIAASTLVDGLRQQYVLAIEAAGAREWRRLDIRVKHPAATVKARSGYFGG
jgi:Ca-activated chloride channel homolog